MTSLKDKFAQATSKLFGSAPKESAVPFELLCDCGHRVAGIRKSTDQIVNCSACRAALYVLPSNPYPVIRSPRGEGREGPVSTRIPERGPAVSPAPEDLPDDVSEMIEADEPNVRTPSRDESSRRKSSRSSGARREPRIETAPVKATDELVPIPHVSFGDRLRRWFAPARLLAMGLVVLVIGTSWWVVQQRRAEEARKAWRREMDLVAPALKNGEFDVLYSSLEKAVEAARVLNRRDGEVLEAESLLAQTNAVRTLSDVDLFAVLAAATNDQGTVDETKAKDAAAIMQGQRLVFDTAFRPAAVRAEDVIGRPIPLLELNCALSVRSTAVRIGIASLPLNDFAASSPKASAIFTATVKSVFAPQAAGKSWQIELDGDSVVFLTTPLHARLCGLDVATIEGLEDRLKFQRAFVRGHNADSETEPTTSDAQTSSSAGGDANP